MSRQTAEMEEDKSLVDALILEAEELIQTFPAWTFTKMMRSNHLMLQLLVVLLERVDGRPYEAKEQADHHHDPFAY